MRIEFWTSVGGTETIGGLLRELRQRGHDAVEVCAISDKAYRAARIGWRRVLLRWRLYAGLIGPALRSRWMAPPGTIRVVTTNPFFLPAWLAFVGGRKASNVFLLWDLYPDVLALAGAIRSGGAEARVIGSVTRYALRNCAATVFLTPEIRAYVERTHGPALRAKTIPVGAPGDLFPDRPAEAGGRLDIQYMGAMGHMHDTTALERYWSGAAAAPVRWRFHSSGAGYTRLRQAHAAGADRAHDVAFHGPLPASAWVRALTESPVALITLKAGAEKLVMPSKTYSALLASQAILAVCARNSDLARLVEGGRCGWVVEPGDGAGLALCVRELHADPDGLRQKRERARELGRRFDFSTVVMDWESLFAAITLEQAAPGVGGQ